MKRSRVTFVLELCVLLLAASQCSCAEEKSQPDKVRQSVIAGSWYPGSARELKSTIDKYLTTARKSLKAQKSLPTDKPVGLIAPHAGYVYSGQCAAYGYACLEGKSYRTVFVLGPSHYAGFNGISIPAFSHYETPLGRVALDRDVCDRLLAKKPFVSLPEAHMREHSVEIELPFLQHVLKGNFKFVPMVVGELDEKGYAQAASALSEVVGEDTLIVASSDFTHYGAGFAYVPFTEDIKENLARLDGGAIERIVAKDFSGFLTYVRTTGITICGYRPIAILLKVLAARPQVSARKLAYATSGEMTDIFTTSVSYASILFTLGEQAQKAPDTDDEKAQSRLSEDEQRTLLRLARDTLRAYLKDGTIIEAKGADYHITPALQRSAGVFVTLKQGKNLRGCIGYIVGMKSLWQAVMDNAISAATRDHRFKPVQAEELGELTIEISVMSPLKKILDANQVEVGKHGLYLIKGQNQGILLPQVATELGWNREQFLEGVCRKALLPADAWKHADLYVFSAQVFSEKEMGR